MSNYTVAVQSSSYTTDVEEPPRQGLQHMEMGAATGYHTPAGIHAEPAGKEFLEHEGGFSLYGKGIDPGRARECISKLLTAEGKRAGERLNQDKL